MILIAYFSMAARLGTERPRRLHKSNLSMTLLRRHSLTANQLTMLLSTIIPPPLSNTSLYKPP